MLVTPWHWEATNKKEGHSTHPWPQVWWFILCDQFVRQNPAFLIRARPKICRKLPREATPTTALERTIVIQQRNMKVVFDKEVDDRWFEPVVPQCGTWKSRQYYCSGNYMNQGIMCVCFSHVNHVCLQSTRLCGAHCIWSASWKKDYMVCCFIGAGYRCAQRHGGMSGYLCFINEMKVWCVVGQCPF